MLEAVVTKSNDYLRVMFFLQQGTSFVKLKSIETLFLRTKDNTFALTKYIDSCGP